MMKKTLSILMCVLCLAAVVTCAGAESGVAHGDGATGIHIVSIVTNESEILTEDEIRAVTGRLEGKTVALDELQSVVDEINELYAKKNYVTARAILPPQAVENGIVQIQLVEGRVGEVVVIGNDHTRDAYFLKRISLRPGDLLRLDSLEDDLMYFNLTNDVMIKAELRAGKEFGTTDLLLIAEEQPTTQAFVFTDNDGRSEIGKYRTTLNIVHNSLFGLRDNLTASATLSTGSLGMSASYEIPLGTRGARFSVRYDCSRTHIISGPLETVGVDGSSSNVGVGTRWPVAVEPTVKTYGSLGWQSRQSDHYFSGSKLISSSLQTMTLSSTTQSIGDGQLWQIQHDITAGKVAVPEPKDFLKYCGAVLFQSAVPKDGVLTCRATFQVTNDKLLPSSEQFAIGGMSTVRGYQEGKLIGDKGYLLSAEVSYPISQQVRGTMFIDHGGAFPFKGDEETIVSSDFVTSLGVGATVSFTDYLSGSFVAGVPTRIEDGPLRFHLMIHTSL